MNNQLTNETRDKMYSVLRVQANTVRDAIRNVNDSCRTPDILVIQHYKIERS